MNGMMAMCWGLRVKIGAMVGMYVALVVLAAVFAFRPDIAYSFDFVSYALGALLALTMLDFVGRVMCWQWPGDMRARIAVIGSTACQLGTLTLETLALIDTRTGNGRTEDMAVLVSFLLLSVVTQAASAILFMSYTRRVCQLIGQEQLAWRPALVLAAYGISGVGVLIMLIILLLLAFAAFCCSYLGAFALFSAFAFRCAVCVCTLGLVFLPFLSYGKFLWDLARRGF